MMKTTFTLLFLLLVGFVNAQLPNPGFENWTNNGNFDNLVDWTTGNPLSYAVTGLVAVTPSTDARTDSLAARLQVLNDSTIGRVNGNVYGTFPTITRHGNLEGYYKLSAPSPAPIEVSISIRDSSSVEIGSGLITLTTQTTSYLPFTVPITYTSSDAAAEMYIHVCACTGLGGNSVIGTDLHIDDFSVQGLVVGNEATMASGVFIAPNPASDWISVRSGSALGPVVLMDLTGRVLKEAGGDAEVVLDVQDLAAGVYVVRAGDVVQRVLVGR